MLFNSVEFLLYFPLVVGLYFWLPVRWRWLHLLLASYIFYMAWEPAYALLIAASTVVDYGLARAMRRTAVASRRALLLSVSVGVNLGLIGSFKYYNLINGTFKLVVEASLGVHWPLPESSLLLPVGISFYTFQTLAYTIDVYRGTQEPERHLGKFALYVSYFPQLVAGPIERAGRLLPQLPGAERVNWDDVAAGLRQMGWGFFQKVVVADRLAVVVNAVYGDPEGASFASFLLATVMFGYQVYCDFAGYSNIAIGAARVMGVHLMKNFDQPHCAQSLGELWQRWHISLTSWFRDYLYIPLGGSRVGVARYRINILIVFALSGLWHGGGWNFLAWGLVNGAIVIAEQLTSTSRDRFFGAMGLARSRVRRAWQTVLTVMMFQVGTLPLFRADDIRHVLPLWGSMANGLGLDSTERMLRAVGIDPVMLGVLVLLMATVDVVDWRVRVTDAGRAPRGVTRLVLDVALMFGVLTLGRFDREAFLYFQF